MTLPDYFLADLNTEPTPELVREAARTLRRNRLRFLAHRTTDEMVGILAEVASNWRHPDDRFRQIALEEAPTATRFSEPVLRRGLDDFFGQVTADQLEALLEQELGHGRRLDRFVAEDGGRGAALARGPDLMVHVTAGNLPVPALQSMVSGLLLRSAQFVKCPAAGALMPRLFAHSIYAVDPKLAACLEVASWPGGRESLEAPLFEEASLVTATGRDETLASIRRRLPETVRFVGYGHRVSFIFVSRDCMSRAGVRQWLPGVVDDVVAWDQQGCLSPHILYLEEGGAMDAEEAAELLAKALDEREATEPRWRLNDEEAAVVRTKRDFYMVRSAHSEETRLWMSKDSTAWTVVYERDPLFQASSLNRFVYVKPTPSLEELLRVAEPVREQVSTVGLAAPARQMEPLALQLARWGVSRVCPVGRMQRPPLTWHHDGRSALGDLLFWTDLEPCDP